MQVQYPGLEDQMKFDLATMSLLSDTIQWVCIMHFLPQVIILARFFC